MPLPLGDFGAAVADFVPVGDWLFEIVPLAASNRPWPGRAEGPPLVSPPRIVARSRLRLSFSCSGTRKIRHPPPSFVRPWPGHPIPLYISLSQLLGREEGVGVQEMGRWGGCWDSFTSMALYQKSPNPRRQTLASILASFMLALLMRIDYQFNRPLDGLETRYAFSAISGPLRAYCYLLVDTGREIS